MKKQSCLIYKIILIIGATVLTACGTIQPSGYIPVTLSSDPPSPQPSLTQFVTETPKNDRETQTPAPTRSLTPTLDLKKYTNSWVRFYDHIYGISFEYPSIYEERPYQDVCAPFETRAGAHFGEKSEVFVFQRLDTTLDEHVQSFLPKYHPDEQFKLESQEAIQVNNQPAIAVKHKLGDTAELRELVFVTVSESKTIYTFSFIDGNACDVPEIGLSERTVFEHVLETFYVEK